MINVYPVVERKIPAKLAKIVLCVNFLNESLGRQRITGEKHEVTLQVRWLSGARKGGIEPTFGMGWRRKLRIGQNRGKFL